MRLTPRATALLAALALGPSLLIAPPASAAPAVTCTFSGDVLVDPGIGALPSSGRFESDPDKDGSYRCKASYGPAKTGTASVDGRYGTESADTCADGGEGDGTLHLGDDGAGDFTYDYGPFSAAGIATGRFHSERFNGTLKLIAKEGDCTLTPLTRIRLEGKGTYRP